MRLQVIYCEAFRASLTAAPATLRYWQFAGLYVVFLLFLFLMGSLLHCCALLTVCSPPPIHHHHSLYATLIFFSRNTVIDTQLFLPCFTCRIDLIFVVQFFVALLLK